MPYIKEKVKAETVLFYCDFSIKQVLGSHKNFQGPIEFPIDSDIFVRNLRLYFMQSNRFK